MAFDLATAQPEQTGGGFDLSTAQPEQTERTLGEQIKGVGEAALTAGTGAVSSVAGGLIGSAIAPFTEEGTGAGVSQLIQQKGTILPETEAGKESLDTLGKGVQFIVDKFRVPVSGVAGIIQLVEGQGIDQAVKTIESVQDEGLGETRAQQILAEGGSPLTATAARVLPEAAVEIAGALTGGSAIRRGAQAAEKLPAAASEALTTGKQLFREQSPVKQEIARRIEAGETDIDLAGFKLENQKLLADDPSVTIAADGTGQLPKPRVVKDAVQKEVVRQDIDPGVVTAIKQSSPSTKKAMLEQVDILEGIINNRLKGQRNRPDQVAGDALTKRFNIVQEVNKNAGRDLGQVAKDLAGKKVDFDPVIGKWVDMLEELDISINAKGVPEFKGSSIEFSGGDKTLIKNITKRIRDNGPNPDALRVHKLKKMIDNSVSFGKTAKGGATKAGEATAKRIRGEVDNLLDTNFPEYNRLNTVFAETRQAMDGLQEIAGKKVDLLAPQTAKRLGTRMRSIMAKTVNRVDILNAMDELDRVAKKATSTTGRDLVPIGTKVADLTDSMEMLVLFDNELARRFGDVARQSFTGGIEQAAAATARGGFKGGVGELGVQAAIKGTQKLRGINNEAALKSLKALLKE